MSNARFFLFGALVGSLAALLAVSFFACQKDPEPGDELTEHRTLLPGQQSSEELATPVARVDDVVITLGEFQDRINRQSPYVRTRYTSLENKKEFLEKLIRFEVMAKEAFRRGFDKDKEVVLTMKNVMIQKLMKDEFENKIKPEDITDEEMLAFYKEHDSEYNKPEEMRVSAIIVKSKSAAKKVAREAAEKGQNPKAFRDLVSRYSVDEATKIRGGDLRYFSRESTEIPKPVIDAAFALKKPGEIAGPIDAGDGMFYIIKQTGKRKAFSKTFEDVKRQIQNRIYRDRRTETQKEFIANLKKEAKIEIFADKLDKVRIDTSTQGVKPGHSAGDGHGHGKPKK